MDRLLVAASLILLAACQAAPVSPTATIPAVPPSVVSPPTVFAADFPVFVYERTTGDGMTYERWEVFADGRMMRVDGTESYLSPEEMMTLMLLLEEAGFYGMEDTYLSSDMCCDRALYVLSVRTAGEIKTVAVVEGAPGEPPALQELILQVDMLLREGA